MLTIENIENIRILANSLRVKGERWQLDKINTGRDVYQFVFRCVEAHPASGLFREAVINLGRNYTMVDLGVDVYPLQCITNGKSRLVGTPDLREPGALIGPLLRVIQGC
jgi:hypothetical protein